MDSCIIKKNRKTCKVCIPAYNMPWVTVKYALLLYLRGKD